MHLEFVDQYDNIFGLTVRPISMIKAKKAFISPTLVGCHFFTLEFRDKVLESIYCRAYQLLSVTIIYHNSSVKNKLKYEICNASVGGGYFGPGISTNGGS